MLVLHSGKMFYGFADASLYNKKSDRKADVDIFL